MVEGEGASSIESEPLAGRAARKRHHTLTNGDLVIRDNPIIIISDNASSPSPAIPECSNESAASQIRVLTKKIIPFQ